MKKLTTKAIATCMTLLLSMAAVPTSTSVANAEGTAETFEYVDKDHTCYFKDPEGTIWEFDKIYVLEEGTSFTNDILATYDCEGVVCRKYEGEGTPFYVQPYTKDLYEYDDSDVFEYRGDEYHYNIIPNGNMRAWMRQTIMEQIVGMYNDAEPTYLASNIAKWDYKRDGQLDIADVCLFNARYMATPFNFCSNLAEDDSEFEHMDYEMFFKILNEYDAKGKEEIEIFYGDVPPSFYEVTFDMYSAAEMVQLAKQAKTSAVVPFAVSQ